MRGFLVQTLIALLEALRDDPPWTSVTLEPDLDSEKVDILWAYRDGTTKAVQVKSSQNPFSKTKVEQWAADLQKWKGADRYELMPGRPRAAGRREAWPSGRRCRPHAEELGSARLQERRRTPVARFA
jgi:hypothetical protein